MSLVRIPSRGFFHDDSGVLLRWISTKENLMICPHCKEQIEVGEAHEEAVIGEKTRYFHVGHLQLYKKATAEHYQLELQLHLQTVDAAGRVC